MKSYTNIDEYIALFPPEIQNILRDVRAVMRKAAPGAEEKISWRMPALYQGKNSVYFAAMKNHLGLYPGAEGITAFAKELAPYKTSKGAAQFPWNKPVPLELIAKITRYRMEMV